MRPHPPPCWPHPRLATPLVAHQDEALAVQQGQPLLEGLQRGIVRVPDGCTKNGTGQRAGPGAHDSSASAGTSRYGQAKLLRVRPGRARACAHQWHARSCGPAAPPPAAAPPLRGLLRAASPGKPAGQPHRHGTWATSARQAGLQVLEGKALLRTNGRKDNSSIRETSQRESRSKAGRFCKNCEGGPHITCTERGPKMCCQLLAQTVRSGQRIQEEKIWTRKETLGKYEMIATDGHSTWGKSQKTAIFVTRAPNRSADASS